MAEKSREFAEHGSQIYPTLGVSDERLREERAGLMSFPAVTSPRARHRCGC